MKIYKEVDLTDQLEGEEVTLRIDRAFDLGQTEVEIEINRQDLLDGIGEEMDEGLVDDIIKQDEEYAMEFALSGVKHMHVMIAEMKQVHNVNLELIKKLKESLKTAQVIDVGIIIDDIRQLCEDINTNPSEPPKQTLEKIRGVVGEIQQAIAVTLNHWDEELTNTGGDAVEEK